MSKAVSRKIRAVGTIRYDEGKLKTLAAYVDGRIDRLYADYTGVVVNEGDELALLYSPELYTLPIVIYIQFTNFHGQILRPRGSIRRIKTIIDF